MLQQWFPKGKHDEPVIDGLRGLSVLMIILFHCFLAVFLVLKDQPDRLQQFIQQIPFSFLLTTDKAVDIFFLVSAYLLSRGLFVSQQRPDFKLSTFYIRRWFRIYPLFFLALLLYGATSGTTEVSRWVLNLFFMDNWVHSASLIPVGWSLSVEVQFYLCLPLITLIMSRSGHGLKVLGSLIFLSILLRWLAVISDSNIITTPFYEVIGNPDFFMNKLYYPTYSRITPLLLGVLWAWFAHKNILKPVNKTARAALFILALALLALSTTFPQYNAGHWYYHAFPETIYLWMNGLMILLHRTLFTLAVLLIVMWPPPRWLQLKLWRPVSQMCFPMYLFHFPMVAVAWITVLGTTDVGNINQIPLWQVGATFVLATLLTIAISLFLHFLLEKPAIRLGNQLVGYQKSKEVTVSGL
ncbi:MAG: acyltransferase family protein [Endozoicomonas sp.]